MSRASNRGGGQRAAVLTGAGAGAVAYVVGYLLTFVLMRAEVQRTFEGSVPTWKAVGWYYYNAHFVDLVSSRSVAGFGDSAVVSLIAESSGSTATLLYAIPPLVLVAAGVAVAWRLEGPEIGTAAAGGAATIVGYGVLAVLGALLFPHEISGAVLGIDLTATFTIPLGSALIIAGLLYPGVFGTAGAAGGAALLGED